MQDKLDKLKELSELLNSEIISQSEFETLKKELLDSKTVYKPQPMHPKEEFIAEEESPLMNGSCNYLKGIMNVKQGTAYLTTKRFLFGKRGGLFEAVTGPLLMHLSKGGQIVIDIEFSNLKRIEKKSHGFASKYVFHTKDGKDYTLQFNRKAEQWLNSICEAAKRDVSGLQVNKHGDVIDFI